MRELTMGSLFAGIGGFDLGFERAGFKTVWQVEIDPFCRKVLAKNFPHAERYEDIRECGAHNLKPVDIICGGFPCQDISNAGLRAGIEGERSGLWGEMCRIIGELRPRFVLVENVAALLGRGMGRVLGDLSQIGYDAEWEIVSAADVGAPHLRERIWISAYPNPELCGRNNGRGHAQGSELRYQSLCIAKGLDSSLAYPESDLRGASRYEASAPPHGSGSDVAHASSDRCEGFGSGRDAGIAHGYGAGGEVARGGNANAVADPDGEQHEGRASSDEWPAGSVIPSHAYDSATARFGQHRGEVHVRTETVRPDSCGCEQWWAVEPDVCRVDDGLPQRLDGGLDARYGMDTEGDTKSRAEVSLRNVWSEITLRASSQGRGSDEQLSRELGDALPVMPYEFALGYGQESLAAARRYVQRMRQALEAVGSVRDASEPLSPAWLSLLRETQDRCHLASCGRTDWPTGEWLGVTRVAHGVPARVDRLRGLGNAVVPQIPELYARRIRQILEAA